jgi:hypothetical protein
VERALHGLEPDVGLGKIRLGPAISDELSNGMSPPHQLMPALTWSGDEALDGREFRLFRGYVFSDRDCVNVVFKGSVTGSPSFAPRVNGPLKLPANPSELDAATFEVLPNDKNEHAKTFTADTFPLVSNESFEDSRTILRLDLPDLDKATTRYYWTVVPVAIVESADTGQYEYWDYESPQDACRAGRVGVFGKNSKPAQTQPGDRSCRASPRADASSHRPGVTRSCSRALSLPGALSSGRRGTRSSGPGSRIRGGSRGRCRPSRLRPCSPFRPASGTTESAG